MRPKDSRWPAADFSPKSNWRRSGRGLPDERASGREYTLSRADLDLIAKKRTASNQLGFAVLILWNTKYLEVAYAELRRQGGTINDDLLRHVAPLGWKHIGLTGDYV